MRAAFILLFFLLVFQSYSQIFSNYQKIQIQDNKRDADALKYPITVKGLKDKINDSFGIQKVCITIEHEKVSDLKIELFSPDGTSIWLTNRNGGDSGKNYQLTCFEQIGFNGPINEGKAPFLGTYTPDGILGFFNNNQNPNGEWYLLIHDLAPNNTGKIIGVELKFSNQPAIKEQSACVKKNGNPCECINPKKKKCDLLPDLIVSENLSKTQWQEYAVNDKIYPGQLRVAIGTANVGAGPLETIGTNEWYCGNNKVLGPNIVCEDGSNPRQKIQQVIYSKKKNKVKKYTIDAGTNYYDSMPGHDHFHADDWVEFKLVEPVDGFTNPLDWKVIATGKKVSYCLFDTGNCTDENKLCQKDSKSFYSNKNLINYGFGRYVSCENYIQGISVGGVDIYGQTFEGQHLDLPDNICNGIYFLIVTVDPENRYLESNENNNSIFFPIEIKLREKCDK